MLELELCLNDHHALMPTIAYYCLRYLFTFDNCLKKGRMLSMGVLPLEIMGIKSRQDIIELFDVNLFILIM